MRQLGLIAACIISLCASAAADTAPTTKETLVIPPYPDGGTWKKITNVDTAEQIYFEWIPADQSENDIKDILVEQVSYKLRGYPPREFVKGLFIGVTRACQSVRVNGPVEHVENGYPIAYAQEYCSNQTGADKDVDIFVKVISGKDALYIVQREFRRPAEKNGIPGVRNFGAGKLEEVRNAMRSQELANTWLTTVQLCPPASAECPAKTQGAAKPTGPLEIVTIPPHARAQFADDPSADDRDPFGFFTVNTSKAEEVRQKLGKPEREIHDPDGGFVFTYISPAGVRVAYQFDPLGKLVHIRSYKPRQ